MGTSGVPETVGGVDFGFTDFSEFAVQASLPSGITAFGICGGESPTDEEIKNDPAEGNYFFMDGHSVQSWGYGLDAFDAIIDEGELLARIYVNVVATRRGIGPAMNLSGLIGQPCGSPDFDGEGGGVFLRAGVDIESAGSQNNDGSGSVPINGADFQEAFQNGAWAWQRVRITDIGGGNLSWLITTWYGDLLDEPAAVDGSNASSARLITGAVPGALGWMMTQFGSPGDEQRIAYLSFTGDPDEIAAPTPVTTENEKPVILSPRVEYDARRLSPSHSDGDDVALWPNSASGGGGNDAVPDPFPHHPAFRPDRWAPGVPSVEFLDLGTSTFPPDNEEAMDYSAQAAFAGTELTIFIVAQVVDISAGAAMIGTRFGATPPREIDVCVFSTGEVFFGFGSEGIPGPNIFTNIASAAGTVKAGDKVIITCRSTNGAAGVSPEGMLIRVNGVQVASVPGFIISPIGVPGPGGVQQGSLGRSQNTGANFVGLPNGTVWGADRLIAWIGGYASAATNEQIVEMEAFLNELFDVIPPLTLPDTVRPSQVSDLWSAGALRDKGPAGLIQTRNTKAAGWMFTMTYPLLSVRDFDHQELTTFIYTAWQRGQIFNAKHPLQPGSGLRPNGLGSLGVALNGAAAVRDESIITDGWPASTQFVARAGDAILIDGDSGVYIITETASSDGAGGAELFITPPLRKAAADGSSVQTTDVPFRVTISDRSSLERSSHPQNAQGPAVTFLEALA